MSNIGYLLNEEVGKKVPELKSGKIPQDYLPVVTPESINADEKGTASTAIASHESTSNPHPSYSLITHIHTPASVGAEPLGAASVAIATHEKALNPHNQYSLANHSHSPASVGADPAGTAAGAIGNHVATSDPHSNYLNTARLVSALTGTGGLLSAPTWHNLTLVNGWSGASAQYTKLSNGLILLTGLLSKSGKSVGEVIATLPAGYRPNTTIRFSSCDSSKDSQPYLDINTAGQIIFNNRNPPNNTIGLTLSGIIYVGS